jgi:hypothetical protein
MNVPKPACAGVAPNMPGTYQVVQVHELLQGQKLLADALRLLHSTIMKWDCTRGFRCAAAVLVRHVMCRVLFRVETALLLRSTM